MAKKTKQGKNRKDKFYNLAKDQGYRARSAFKLIQLAKKFDFLSKAQVCLDLCAAPGGWSQVAQQNMPSGSTIIAVDLVPIKPIHGVTCIQSDITSDKCRSLLKRELLGKRADVVLNDVAPNVGANWARDAYVQNELVLQAMKLACEHLRAGGIFVTKVFRSADYNSLTWVFNQLFGKVEATKPVSSRNVSAEIFVLCKGFKAGRIDPRFFDPKWVFMDPEALDPLTDPAPAASGKPLSLADHLRSQKKRHRSGYEPGDDLKICAAHDFVASGAPAEVLVTHHRIDLAATGSESLLEHPSTTEEIKELCGDLKVLGKKDLSTLLKWRGKILRERERAERAALKAQNGKAVAVISSSSAVGGASQAGEAAAAAKRDAGSKDVDEAIAQLLDDGDEAAGGKAKKAGGEAKATEEEDEVDEDRENEKLERELAEQVEKRRREERRDAKKTMERQKKQEWRRKMSLGNAKQAQDQPELFKGSKKNIAALADQDKYLDPRALDSDGEDSTASGAEQSDSSSDEGLDRLARLEVDVAVDHELRKMRLDDKFRTQQQRKMRKKKETRRQRVMAAWAGEAGAFAEAIQGKAAEQHALRDRDSDAEDDDDDEAGSDDDLLALRALQAGSGGGGFDGEALEALVDGAGAPAAARAALRANEAEAAGKLGKRAAAAADDEDDDGEEEGGEGGGGAGGAGSSTALVPLAEGGEEDLRAEHRMARWFSGEIFRGVQEAKIRPVDQASDSDQDGEGGSDAEGGGKMRELDDSKLPKMPLTDKEKRKLKRRKDKERDERSGKRAKADEDAGPMEVAPLEAPRPLVGGGRPQKPTDPQELAETLALGTLLTQSKKSRMDLIDAAYNRWSFEADEGLPDWFTEEESKNNKPELPVSKELMAQYRAKLREINARPIRKVAEAKARKKRRLNKRLEKLRSTAMSLADTPDMSELAKAKQMRKAVSKMAKQDQRKVSVVAVKKGGGGKRMDKGKVPKGAKVKVVDKRMKSDRRGERKAKARNKSKQKAIARKTSLKKQNKKSGGRGGGRGGGGGKTGKKGGA